jgi:hypothetical protein
MAARPEGDVLSSILRTNELTDGLGNWLPLSVLDVLWTYEGTGVIPQGYLDPASELLPDLVHEIHRAAQQAKVCVCVCVCVCVS